MSYLVDTNVFSEQLKRQPNAKVVAWLVENASELFVSTITIGELKRGIERLPDGKRREDLDGWLRSINQSMRGSILGYSRAVAHTWGQMQGKLDLEGVKLSAFDGIIAATAIRHGLTVVTRNLEDFRRTPVKLLNPFDFE